MNDQIDYLNDLFFSSESESESESETNKNDYIIKKENKEHKYNIIIKKKESMEIPIKDIIKIIEKL